LKAFEHGTGHALSRLLTQDEASGGRADYDLSGLLLREHRARVARGPR
jgi:hypothetical protein